MVQYVDVDECDDLFQVVDECEDDDFQVLDEEPVLEDQLLQDDFDVLEDELPVPDFISLGVEEVEFLFRHPQLIQTFLDKCPQEGLLRTTKCIIGRHMRCYSELRHQEADHLSSQGDNITALDVLSNLHHLHHALVDIIGPIQQGVCFLCDAS